MAKSKAVDVPSAAPDAGKAKKGFDRWEVQDAMHTMMRASEIVRDKPLLAAVKKAAGGYASEMQDKAARAAEFAKRGMISPKQMSKLGAK